MRPGGAGITNSTLFLSLRIVVTGNHKPLFDLSVNALVDGYRSGFFSPVDVVDELSARIERLNPIYNAFTTLDLEVAADKARDSEKAWRRREKLPLLGVPVAVKDIIDTKGLRTTCGSAIFSENVPTVDATVVAGLKQAGAIIIGKSATHEFAWGFTNDNPHYGPTHNPWNRERISGGSSGGSAVAVATGMVSLAIGTDTGGSIRVPGAFCGVCGIKPTYRSISGHGIFPLAASLDHAGGIARDPRDLHLLVKVMQSTPGQVENDNSELVAASPTKVRIGIAECLHQPAPDVDIAAVFKNACEILQEAGATTVAFDDMQIPDIPDVFTTTMLAEALHTHRQARLYPQRYEDYGADIRKRIDLAQKITLDNYLEAAAQRRILALELDKVLAEVDVIISLCAASTPPRIESLFPPATETQDQYDLRRIVLGYTALQNLTGLPACTVRAGFDNQGMPVGIQFTGRMGAEQTVLSIAALFYRLTPDLQKIQPALEEIPSAQQTKA